MLNAAVKNEAFGAALGLAQSKRLMLETPAKSFFITFIRIIHINLQLIQSIAVLSHGCRKKISPAPVLSVCLSGRRQSWLIINSLNRILI